MVSVCLTGCTAFAQPCLMLMMFRKHTPTHFDDAADDHVPSGKVVPKHTGSGVLKLRSLETLPK